MPGYDQTGPKGAGPMTGRGLGPCGRGLGRGFGWRRCFFQPRELTKDEERRYLEEDLENLKQEQEYTQKRLKELK